MGQVHKLKSMADAMPTLHPIALLRAVVIGLSLSLAFLSISSITAASGTISANTTWTTANSPYTVTDDVTVSSGNLL